MLLDPRLKKIISLLISFLLLFFLAEQLAKLFWHMIAADPAPVVIKINHSSQNSKALDNLHFKNPITPNALQTALANNSTPTSHRDIPETKLNWILQGVYFENKTDNSVAIIRTPKKTYAVYVGDTVESGVTLKAIGPESIVLQNNQKLEQLKLNRKDLKQLVTNIEPVKINQQKIMNSIRVEPVRRKRGNGIKVYNKANKHLLEQYGLKNGDILLEINRKPIDLRNLQQIFLRIDKNEKLSAKIDRQGTIQNITIDIKQE